MPQIISTNVMSLMSQKNLDKSQNILKTALQRLSSGARVNSVQDDAAGLAISERFTTQIRGLDQNARNAADGISLSQTAEGALDEISRNLQRIRQIAVQSANSTNSANDRSSLNEEVIMLQNEVVRVLDGTEFNGVKVLGVSATLIFQVGPNESPTTNQIRISTSIIKNTSALIAAMSANVLTVGGSLSAIARFDSAIDEIVARRSEFGSAQNRFETVMRNTENINENLYASRSRIVDADFARETAELTRAQILQQAGTAMLAQANALPENVLTLLQ